jgi:hypothetical protein
MPYALVPDGYTLKKVTAAQMKAVDEKRRHDNVTAVLENETALKIGGAAIGALAIGGLAAVFIPLLEKKVGALSDDIKDAIGEVFDFLNPIPEIKDLINSVNPFYDPDRVNPWMEEIESAQDYMDAQKQRREQGLEPYSSYEQWRSERLRQFGI